MLDQLVNLYLRMSSCASIHPTAVLTNPLLYSLTNKMYLNRVKTVTLIFYFRYVHLLLTAENLK